MSIKGITVTDILLKSPGATISGPIKPVVLARPKRVPGVYEIRIADWIPTPLNKLLHVHWGTRAKMKRFDCEIVAVSFSRTKFPAATGRRRVRLRVTLPKGKRSPDPDSLYKSLCDALVHCMALVNDSSKWVELGGVEFVRGDRLETVIRLEDI
jgi:hypothetical protein